MLGSDQQQQPEAAPAVHRALKTLVLNDCFVCFFRGDCEALLR